MGRRFGLDVSEKTKDLTLTILENDFCVAHPVAQLLYRCSVLLCREIVLKDATDLNGLSVKTVSVSSRTKS